jgi:hypothetical protein
MHQKAEITKFVAEQEKLSSDEKSIKKLLPKWWQNPRLKNVGGLKLTDEGFAYFTKHFKAHRVRFENDIVYTNQLILRLDNFITCPWYISKKDIYVFNDKMAVQLVLFSGNVVRFTEAKAKSLKSSLTTD